MEERGTDLPGTAIHADVDDDGNGLPDVAAGRTPGSTPATGSSSESTCTKAPTDGTSSAATPNATSPAAGHHNRGR